MKLDDFERERDVADIHSFYFVQALSAIVIHTHIYIDTSYQANDSVRAFFWRFQAKGLIVSPTTDHCRDRLRLQPNNSFDSVMTDSVNTRIAAGDTDAMLMFPHSSDNDVGCNSRHPNCLQDPFAQGISNAHLYV